MAQKEARLAHNQEVAGASPVTATNSGERTLGTQDRDWYKEGISPLDIPSDEEPEVVGYIDAEDLEALFEQHCAAPEEPAAESYDFCPNCGTCLHCGTARPAPTVQPYPIVPTLPWVSPNYPANPYVWNTTTAPPPSWFPA